MHENKLSKSAAFPAETAADGIKASDMTTIILKFLPVVLLALAAFLGVAMLISGRGKKPATGHPVREDGYKDEPVMVNAVEEKREAYEPSPEELEEVASCVDASAMSAMDEGPSDIETAIAATGDSGRLRLTLVGLLRSGMTIRDAQGRPVTEERLLAGVEKAEEEVPETAPVKDPGNIRRAIDRLDIEFHNSQGRI